jgi:hypothetical protein
MTTPAPQHGITYEHFLDDRATWRFKMFRKTVAFYVIMRPGEKDVALTVEDLRNIDERLPPLLAHLFKNKGLDPDLAGLLVRATLQMWDNLAPPGLSEYCLRPEMRYMLQLVEVRGVSAADVHMYGHFLRVKDGLSAQPIAVGIFYCQDVIMRAETLEQFHPGVMDRLQVLSGMGLSSVELAQQMFRLEAAPSAAMVLPQEGLDFSGAQCSVLP